MTQLSALNVKITGDSADLQSDLSQAKTQLSSFEASAGKATKRTAGFSGSLGKLSNVSGQTRAQIQNTSFQLQDIAVQLQGGTKASTVFAQQLPQLLGGFGALGAAAGVLAGIGIPALAFAFQALGEKSLTLEDALEELKSVMDSYSEASENASMTTQELNEKFGEGAAGLRSTYELLQQIAATEAQEAIDGVAQSVSDLLGTGGAGDPRTELAKFFDVPIVYAFRDATREIRAEARTLTAEFKDQQIVLSQSKGNIDAQIAATQRMLTAAQSLAELKDGVSEEERNFIKQLAEGLALMQQQKAAAAGVSTAIRSSAAEIKKTADQERLLGEQMALTGDQLKINDTILKLMRDGLSASAIDALLLSEVDMVSGVDAAAIAAAELAAKLKISLEEAAKLKALADDPLDPFGGAGRFIPEQSPSWEQQGIDAEENGNGNRNGQQADPLKGELERLQESLMSQEELEIASNERRQEVLRQALEQKYLTQQEYDALMEEQALSHKEVLDRLDHQRQQSAISGYATMFGNMATIFASGGGKLVKIAKAFSIAQGLLNSYRAYTEVLADPTLIGRPFLRQALAASTLAAGLAQVASMRSTSMGGGGGGGGASSASGAGAAAAQAPAQTSNQVAISLTGGDMFSRDQVIQLINSINDAVDDGAQIRLV